jgi:hypothetical protein
MTISFSAIRSTHHADNRDAPSPTRAGGAHAKRRSDASSSPLGGLGRLERLRNALPQPVANALFRRAAPLPSTRASTIDAATRPVEQLTDEIDALRGAGTRMLLLSRATRAEAGHDERASHAAIETILDMCEAGDAVFDDELAGVTFRLIASLMDTPRDRLLDRALDIVCTDTQQKVSPQMLASDKWLFDERITIHERMHTAIMALPDTPERAARIATIIPWIDELPPPADEIALARTIEAIGQIQDMESRSSPLSQLRALADRMWLDGPERGELLVAIDELSGAGHRTLQHAW